MNRANTIDVPCRPLLFCCILAMTQTIIQILAAVTTIILTSVLNSKIIPSPSKHGNLFINPCTFNNGTWTSTIMEQYNSRTAEVAIFKDLMWGGLSSLVPAGVMIFIFMLVTCYYAKPPIRPRSEMTTRLMENHTEMSLETANSYYSSSVVTPIVAFFAAVNAFLFSGMLSGVALAFHFVFNTLTAIADSKVQNTVPKLLIKTLPLGCFAKSVTSATVTATKAMAKIYNIIGLVLPIMWWSIAAVIPLVVAILACCWCCRKQMTNYGIAIGEKAPLLAADNTPRSNSDSDGNQGAQASSSSNDDPHVDMGAQPEVGERGEMSALL